jgi:hypothetical protein
MGRNWICLKLRSKIEILNLKTKAEKNSRLLFLLKSLKIYISNQPVLAISTKDRCHYKKCFSEPYRRNMSELHLLAFHNDQLGQLCSKTFQVIWEITKTKSRLWVTLGHTGQK